MCDAECASGWFYLFSDDYYEDYENDLDYCLREISLKSVFKYCEKNRITTLIYQDGGDVALFYDLNSFKMQILKSVM